MPMSYSAAAAGGSNTTSTSTNSSNITPKKTNTTSPQNKHSSKTHPSTTHHQTPYRRPDAHKPPTTTNTDEEDLYVLSLLTDPAHHAAMSALRARFFPPARLKVDAHITLFHALPGSHLATIRADLAALAARTAPFTLCAEPDGVFEMRQGAGIMIGSGSNSGARGGEAGQGEADAQVRAEAIRTELLRRWESVLSEQDRRPKWRGHYTVMNKEMKREKVDECLEWLRSEFRGSEGRVLGLTLWRYDRGWWKKESDFAFEGAKTER